MNEPMDRPALLGVLIEALTLDDISQANEDVLEAAKRCANYFEVQGIEVRRSGRRSSFDDMRSY